MIIELIFTSLMRQFHLDSMEPLYPLMFQLYINIFIQFEFKLLFLLISAPYKGGENEMFFQN